MTRSGVAVIVTCYNLGGTIGEAVGSVRAQDQPADELLVIDDGSDDLATRQELASLARLGVQVIRTPNRGVSAARNLGIGSTSAPFVALLDGDDAFDPGYIRKMSNALLAGPELAFVSCGMQYFGHATHVWVPDPPELIRSLTRGVVHVSSMFRRSMWAAIGGFDETMRAHEELDFWTTAVERGFLGMVLDEPLLRYRARPGSLYRSAIQAGTHTELMRRFYEKHQHVLSGRVVDLLVEKERFILEQRDHERCLVGIRNQLQSRLDGLHAEIESVTQELRAFGAKRVEFGDLNRTEPISPDWGCDRGIPLDRYYIHRFLERWRSDIAGRVLEVKDDQYARAFGRAQVDAVDIVDISSQNPRATVVADLRDAQGLASDAYDCVILTQTLQFIFNVTAAISETYRILKPGGVLLCTVPAVSRVDEDGGGPDGDCWRFTAASLRKLFASVFPLEAFEVTGRGSALACAAFLYGLSENEIDPAMRDVDDLRSPLLYCVRAVKPPTPPMERERTGDLAATDFEDAPRGLVLMYHGVSDEDEPGPLSITTATLRSHLDYLRNHGWRIVPLHELVESDGHLQARSVALTFDDGYATFPTSVVPILTAYDAPATCFVLTNTGLEEFWWETVRRIFKSSTALPPLLEVPGITDGAPLPVVTESERARAAQAVQGALLLASLEARTRMLAQLIAWSTPSTPPSPAHRPMSVDELRVIASMPQIAIGVHGHHHLWLPAQSLAQKTEEVEASKRRLEDMVGRPVLAMSYPYGGYDTATMDVVRAAGFQMAVTTDHGAVPRAVDQLRIPRIDVGGSDPATFPSVLRTALAGRPVEPRSQGRVLVAGWFSFSEGHATAGDILTRDLLCRWLTEAQRPFDVAVVPPFGPGANWRTLDPSNYTDLVFVCGPFARWIEAELLERFAACRLTGVNLSMALPLDLWNPFDTLLERDSTRQTRPDLSFSTESPPVPVVGICRVEEYSGAYVDRANRAIDALVAAREVSRVEIDTRLDVNSTGLRTAAEVESLIARVDVLVTTRLHGLVLALKHGVPALAIDPEPGGGKIMKQAAVLEWPAALAIDAVASDALHRWLDFCLSDQGRLRAAACGTTAQSRLISMREDFLRALAN